MQPEIDWLVTPRTPMGPTNLNHAGGLALSSDTEDVLSDLIVHVRESGSANLGLHEVLQLDGQSFELV